MTVFDKTSFVFFISIIFLTQSCLNVTQKDGGCTACLATEQLQSGYCYIKIRGCLTQNKLVCSQCQQGYTFLSNDCIRDALVNNLTSLNPPPQSVDSSTLNASQITPILVGGYQDVTNFSSTLFLSAQAKIFAQYPSLSTLKTFKVQQQLVNGMNFIFYIINTETYDVYLVKVYVTFKGQASITEIYKNDQNIMKTTPTSNLQPGQWITFTNYNDSGYNQVSDLLLATYPNVLDAYNLDSVQYQIVAGINYKFNFSNSTYGETFLIQIYLPFFGNATIVSVSGLIPDQQLKAHLKTLSSQTNSASVTVLPGGYQVFPKSNYSSQPFLSVKAVLVSVFPGFNDSWITQVSQQVVSGYNFLVDFTKPNTTDKYQITLYLSLPISTTNRPTITSATKNGLAYSVISVAPAPQITSTGNSTTTQTQAGQFQTYNASNYSSSLFGSIVSTIQTAFNGFSTSWITLVQQQVVAGYNFDVTFKIPGLNDTYIVRVFVPLPSTGNSPIISAIKKNNIDFNVTPFTMINSSSNLAGSAQAYPPSNYSSDQFKSIVLAIKKLYPDFDSAIIIQVQLQVVAGYNYFVTFEYAGSTDVYQVNIFVPLAYTGQGPSVIATKKNGVNYYVLNGPAIPTSATTTDINYPTIYNTSNTIVGQYQNYPSSNYTMQPFITVRNEILKIFPNFTVSLITKVQYQVVQGWNFDLTFTYPLVKSPDSYQVVIYVPLASSGQKPSYTSLKKNGINYTPSFTFNTNGNSTNTSPSVTTSTPSASISGFNWQTDTTFTQVYKYLKATVNITNLLPIIEVTRQKLTLSTAVSPNTAIYQYFILYSSDQNATCRYYIDLNIYEVCSFMADGIDLYKLGLKLPVYGYGRSQLVLSAAIKSYDSLYFSRIFVINITQSKISDSLTVYNVTVVTASGTYIVSIIDSGSLYVIKSTNISSNTCFNIPLISSTQLKLQNITDQIRAYILTKYSLSGFQLTTAVGTAMSLSSKYVFVLTRSDYKKVYVSATEAEDQYTVTYAGYADRSFALVSDSATAVFLEATARASFTQNLTGYDLALTLYSGQSYQLTFANDAQIITYLKGYTSSIIKTIFSSSNACDTKNTVNACATCIATDFLWKGKCFTKVANCAIQVGSICLVCNKYSLYSNGKCLKDCDVFSF